MAEKNYALIKNNNVTNIVVFDDLSEELFLVFLNEYQLDDIVIANEKTEIGGIYDGVKFWPTKPYPSWIKNEELTKWEAPIAMPENKPNKYVWNESLMVWELAPIPTKPFNSWIFDEDSYQWFAPVARPNDENDYEWDEESNSWNLLPPCC